MRPPDAGFVGVFLTGLVIIAGCAVVLATWRRTWVSQTITELRDLADAQGKRIEFLEGQLDLMNKQVRSAEERFQSITMDNTSLVRRNRELEERCRSLEEPHR